MVTPRGNLQITIFFTIDGFLEFFPVCSRGQFLCENHINIAHAGGRPLHHQEGWKVS